MATETVDVAALVAKLQNRALAVRSVGKPSGVKRYDADLDERAATALSTLAAERDEAQARAVEFASMKLASEARATALEAELAEKHRAFSMAHDQAMENGSACNEARAQLARAREDVAVWLESQRRDIPAHGWEFAAALRYLPAPADGRGEVERALSPVERTMLEVAQRSDPAYFTLLTEEEASAFVAGAKTFLAARGIANSKTDLPSEARADGVKVAVAAEREACAQIASGFVFKHGPASAGQAGQHLAAEHIATAIRARALTAPERSATQTMGEELFQYRIDGRPAGPIRTKWVDAAQDAVNDGYASWVTPARAAARLDPQAEISAVRIPAAHPASQERSDG